MNRTTAFSLLLFAAALTGSGGAASAASLTFTGDAVLGNPFGFYGSHDSPLLFNGTLLDPSKVSVATTSTGFSIDAILDLTVNSDGELGLDLFAYRLAVTDQADAAILHITGDVSYSLWSNLEGTTAYMDPDGAAISPFFALFTEDTFWSDFEGIGSLPPGDVPYDPQTGHPAPDGAFTFTSSVGGYPLDFHHSTQLGEEFTAGISGATAGEVIRIEFAMNASVDEATSAAPEPGTWWLTVAGVGVAGARLRGWGGTVVQAAFRKQKKG